jgi:hypothetical protein
MDIYESTLGDRGGEGGQMKSIGRENEMNMRLKDGCVRVVCWHDMIMICARNVRCTE